MLKPRDDFYSESLPTAGDALLIIEVADTSVEYDRNVKLRMYARAIPEVWIADLPGDAVEAHSEPLEGVYRSVHRAIRGEILHAVRLPDFAISVDEVLG